LRSYIDFKGSFVFIEILERYIKYYEHKMVVFEDIYFNGKVIESRHLLKSLLLSSNLNMPTAKKLKIIESRILDKVYDARKARREKIEKVVSNSNRHQFEVKSFTRVLSSRETSAITQRLHKFTEFNCYELYKTLFKNKDIFFKVSKGLNLPENINEIIDYTNKNILDKFNLPYSDGIALLYLKLKAEGCNSYGNIKQVMVDEAQDYYPIHYNILKTLFREARFTVVGDINQSIEKKTNLSIMMILFQFSIRIKALNFFLQKAIEILMK